MQIKEHRIKLLEAVYEEAKSNNQLTRKVTVEDFSYSKFDYEYLVLKGLLVIENVRSDSPSANVQITVSGIDVVEEYLENKAE